MWKLLLLLSKVLYFDSKILTKVIRSNPKISTSKQKVLIYKPWKHTLFFYEVKNLVRIQMNSWEFRIQSWILNSFLFLENCTSNLDLVHQKSTQKPTWSHFGYSSQKKSFPTSEITLMKVINIVLYSFFWTDTRKRYKINNYIFDQTHFLL